MRISAIRPMKMAMMPMSMNMTTARGSGVSMKLLPRKNLQ